MSLILRPEYVDGFLACFLGKILTDNSPYQKVYLFWLSGNENEREKVDSTYPEFEVAWGQANKKREEKYLLAEYYQKHPHRSPVRDVSKTWQEYYKERRIVGEDSLIRDSSVGTKIMGAQKNLDRAIELGLTDKIRQWKEILSSLLTV